MTSERRSTAVVGQQMAETHELGDDERHTCRETTSQSSCEGPMNASNPRLPRTVAVQLGTGAREDEMTEPLISSIS